MYVNQIFELSMQLGDKKFQKVFDSAYRRAKDSKKKFEKNEGGYTDYSWWRRGILVIYQDSQHKKKIKLVINSELLTGGSKPERSIFIWPLAQNIAEYFGNKYHIDDFALSRVTSTANIDVVSRENMLVYMEILQGIGWLKGFLSSDFDFIDEDTGFNLDDKTHGIGFRMYDFKQCTREQAWKMGSVHEGLEPLAKETEGIIRAEVKLKTPEAIRMHTDARVASLQIRDLLEKNEDIFLDTFNAVIPFDPFQPKDMAIEIIRKEVKNRALRDKMLRLVALISEKKPAHLARKEMDCQDIEEALDAFDKYNLSPFTISKRHDMAYMLSIYDYMDLELIWFDIGPMDPTRKFLRK